MTFSLNKAGDQQCWTEARQIILKAPDFGTVGEKEQRPIDVVLLFPCNRKPFFSLVTPCER
jgi:hypothetical protein